ncbi:esterase [Polaribacter reichenbachii]|uniref:Esterase n=1 Tax=Polaribacter reichenbachii TaxID=996801 RepID=A0A1B8TRM0_9FLAO|nr:alpha/beta hydrolase-fold protein [Polaribacter reichenbachii]APZ47763.1 esterase [Polaribacter reichenbachii]AUC18398.1 esterase [Polaribacter reichenbachii]OBY62252.1 esterase [Polaribacter reichenbachii]
MKYLSILFSIVLLFSCKQAKQEVAKAEVQKTKIVAKDLDSVNLFAGKLIRVDSFPTKYITPRPVDVWLPEGYSSEKKYAVLYMHDGQMLFDETTTWNKQEWKIDEVASKLMKDGITKDFIVVGIHNIAALRWLDLYPEKAMSFLTKEELEVVKSFSNSDVEISDLTGDEYLKFLVEDLKPYVDKTYSVYTNKENTFVAGSSMGGLMSMYAISQYPDVFKGAACISTHWVGAQPVENNPLPKSIFKYLEHNVPDAKTHKVYFDYGNKTLDQYYPEYAPKVDSIFLHNGYSESNFKNLFFEGTNHSEISWQNRIDIPLTFLLKK